MSEIRLIVNADDFGLGRGITDAIVIAHRYGFLTSASLMANMPGAEYAVSRARSLPNLSVGVHLNICQGRPLLPPSQVRTLIASDGNFHAPSAMARRLWARRVAPAEIESEFRAQIRWTKQRGVVPSHADSHHHMHLYPCAARAFARALQAEDIGSMRASSCVALPKRSFVGPYSGHILRRVSVGIYRRALQRTTFSRLQSPESRIAISLGKSGDVADLRERWKAALENLPPGTFELACHPGLFERGFSESDAIHKRREEELICLTDRDLRDVMQRRSIRLISYRELPAGACAETKASEAVA